MDEDTLIFIKKYKNSRRGNKDTIFYDFKKEGDIRVGKYKRGSLVGDARCRTFSLLEQI